MAAIDQVIAVVGALSAPVPARPDQFSQEPRLAALYASGQSMPESFGRAPELLHFRASSAGRGAGEIFALLLAERQMRNVPRGSSWPASSCAAR